MTPAIITCPHCATSLTTSASVSAGSRFRCPCCRAAFAVPGPDAPAPFGTRPLPSAAPDETAASGNGWMVLIGVVVLAVLLLAGAGGVLAWRVLAKPESPSVAATTARPQSPPAPDKPPENSVNNDPQKNPAPRPPPEPPWLPADKQGKVNAAIKRGVDYLKKMPSPEGTWSFDHATGMAALPGLTLLECGVPPEDESIQKAARYVRKSIPNLNTTYELGLAILFLDRLGDQADEPLIRTMALRLLVGQHSSGGWTYDCPVPSGKEEQNLLAILQTTRPRSALDLMVRDGGDGFDGLLSRRDGNGPSEPIHGSMNPLPTDDDVKRARRFYGGLSPGLQSIPALAPAIDDDDMPRGDNTDNSNTQFATLGLWAAGRHGVPMERALARLAQRFQVSQEPRGDWNYNFIYHPPDGEERPPMTGAGLLGLAVGHGVTADLKADDAPARGEDPQVEKGMKALAHSIRMMKEPGYLNGKMAGLYFLWSVERVGMLYGRRALDGKEWYPWGVDLLLPAQNGDGSWYTNGYYGSTPVADTSFALLFLKRANLAKDLSTKLEFLTPVKEK
ncbi:MAG TPA: hypothetical protein VMS17_27830 [Gemmataceae bacterium]|nr:hypothetical protein [Gemmataceae bacterium]